MIPKFNMSNWLGRIFNVHGQYAVLRSGPLYSGRLKVSTKRRYLVCILTPTLAGADLTFQLLSLSLCVCVKT